VAGAQKPSRALSGRSGNPENLQLRHSQRLRYASEMHLSSLLLVAATLV
jgi:hypothetical protein